MKNKFIRAIVILFLSIIAYFILGFIIAKFVNNFSSPSASFISAGAIVFELYLVAGPIIFIVIAILLSRKQERGKKILSFITLIIVPLLLLFFLSGGIAKILWQNTLFSVLKHGPPSVYCNLTNLKNLKVDEYEKDKCYLFLAKEKSNIKICKKIRDNWYDIWSARYFSKLPYDSMKRNCYGEVSYSQKNINLCQNYQSPEKCNDYFHFLNNACNKINDNELKIFCSNSLEISHCNSLGNTEERNNCYIDIAGKVKDYKICNKIDKSNGYLNFVPNEKRKQCYLNIYKNIKDVKEICNTNNIHKQDIWECFASFAHATGDKEICNMADRVSPKCVKWSEQ